MQEINIKNYEKKILELKEKIDFFKPFSSSQFKNLQSWFKIGFTAQSNAIEGNSFTNEEVKILIEDGITVGGKTIKEGVHIDMILEINNVDGYNVVLEKGGDEEIKKVSDYNKI